MIGGLSLWVSEPKVYDLTFAKIINYRILNGLPLPRRPKDVNPTAGSDLLKSSVFLSGTQSSFNCSNWKRFTNAFHLDSEPGPVQSLHCGASGFRRSCGLPKISPSQAWVDVTAAEDPFLIPVGRKCFLRRSSSIRQAGFVFFRVFFPPYFLCRKAAVMDSTGGLHLSPRAFSRTRTKLHRFGKWGNWLIFAFFLSDLHLKGQCSAADVTPPVVFGFHFTHFSLVTILG